MKKIIISLFLIFSVTVAIFAVNYNVSIAKDKPTVLYIYGQFCGACKQFEPTFNALESKFSSKFHFVKEDISSSQRAKSLNVSETPSVYIINQNGAQKISWDCLSQPGCFEQRLKNY